ncbi:Holliday junction resolvase RuvC [Helicobacter sp. NHP19-003]|uniref:Crossover junction endodeoxyribonuclease RuvC n=1 Tax=Helicobacter gastrocanis TaxID=2849641 RepID=A0ABM7SC88_9HELI|nr:Holliday junction resolvase RuvC [Helicobacter sp. NHP19-003]
MLVLGIDPGSRKCGYGVVDLTHIKLIGAGFIKVPSAPLQEQILEVVAGLEQVFRTYPIAEVAMEDIFYAYNPKSVLKLAQFRGALGLKILQEKGHFSEYTPYKSKKRSPGMARRARNKWRSW